MKIRPLLCSDSGHLADDSAAGTSSAMPSRRMRCAGQCLVGVPIRVRQPAPPRECPCRLTAWRSLLQAVIATGRSRTSRCAAAAIVAGHATPSPGSRSPTIRSPTLPSLCKPRTAGVDLQRARCTSATTSSSRLHRDHVVLLGAGTARRRRRILHVCPRYVSGKDIGLASRHTSGARTHRKPAAGRQRAALIQSQTADVMCGQVGLRDADIDPMNTVGMGQVNVADIGHAARACLGSRCREFRSLCLGRRFAA